MSKNTGRFTFKNDLVGKQFGNLIAIKRVGSNRYGATWLCKCTCGNDTTVNRAYLVTFTHPSKSCGCANRSIKDLLGKIFGYLTVISRHGSYKHRTTWLCRCVCNKERIVSSASLHGSKVVSCGCKNKTRLIDLTNKKIGHLTVIKRIYKQETSKSSSNNAVWLCRCVCDRLVEMLSNGFNENISCGCKRGSNISKAKRKMVAGDISKEKWSHIIYGAKKRDIDFDISADYVWGLFQKQKNLCALSGREIYLPPKVGSRSMPNRGRNCTASLDRIDSDKGYVLGNVQWIHKDFQFMKLKISDRDFISACKEVAKWNEG